MNLKIEYIDPQESFGMGGPFIGKLKVNEKELNYEYLAGNYVRADDAELIAFNCFIPYFEEKRRLGFFTSAKKIRRFRILVFDIITNKWFISNDFWSNLYLTKFKEGAIFFTEAFHNGDWKMFPEKSVEWGNGTFTEIDDNELKKVPHNTMYKVP